MTEEKPGLESDYWRGVDRTGDPGSFVGYLDKAAVSLRDAWLEAQRLLELRPGCSVLDVGSGAGQFLIEAASNVDGIRAVGIDFSDTMVKTATSRAHAAGVVVTFAVGNAQHLDFPDRSFDRVNCSRVLLHLEDPRAAIHEMARVLSVGGRVVILEPDFDAMMIDSKDLRIASAVRRQLTAGIRHPDIGRSLRRLLLEVGLDVLEFSGVARTVPSLQAACENFHIRDHLDAAVASGEVEADSVEEWWRLMEAADTSDRLFVGPVLFRALATKTSL
jgi:SAM-dependent methyltransferase